LELKQLAQQKQGIAVDGDRTFENLKLADTNTKQNPNCDEGKRH
jgi:hypothetical protein